MTREEAVAVFNDSLQRCGRRSKLLERFYEIFLTSSPEVAQKFAHTDFRRQRRVLAASLYTIMDLTRRNARSNPELERIAQIHSRSERDIRPELYDLWLNSLIQAVRECDPGFTAEVEQAWRAVLQRGIDLMKACYNRRPASQPHTQIGG